MRKISVILFLSMGLLFQSCNDDIIERERGSAANQRQLSEGIENLELHEQDRMKLEFGRVFASAIKDNQGLRALIKQEALKMFNKDYDVMYHLIKNRSLDNGQTVRSLLISYFDDENRLIQIENQLPLLTIFVPKLPENSFSAETWNVNNLEQIPVVGIRLDRINEVPMIDALNEIEYLLDEDLIPGYPVVVIKNNERLVVNTGNHNFLRSSEILDAGDGLTYQFLDDNFNNILTPAVLTPYLDDPTGGNGNNGNSCTPPFPYVPGRQNNVAQFLKDAYNVFDGVVTQAWQRDNIYYQLTPEQTTNTYVGGKYVEAITYFKLTGNPKDVFNFMSNQFHGSNPDPQLINQDWSSKKRTPWTDGNFEIGISITDNSKQRGTLNTTLAFDAKPSDLFTYTYETKKVTQAIFWKKTYYKPIINGFKGIDFTSLAIDATQLHINPWDLNEYSNHWYYEVKELDFTTNHEFTTTNVKKYNTNIQVDVGFSLWDIVKIGLKFGASSEETNTDARVFKWVEGDDFLGQFDVAFGDNILNKNPCNNQLYPRVYSSSRCLIEIRPIQVQD